MPLRKPGPTGPDQIPTLAITLDQEMEEIEINTDQDPGTDMIMTTNLGQEQCLDQARQMAQTI